MAFSTANQSIEQTPIPVRLTISPSSLSRSDKVRPNRAPVNFCSTSEPLNMQKTHRSHCSTRRHLIQRVGLQQSQHYTESLASRTSRSGSVQKPLHFENQWIVFTGIERKSYWHCVLIYQSIELVTTLPASVDMACSRNAVLKHIFLGKSHGRPITG